jgi:hypothetical protein
VPVAGTERGPGMSPRGLTSERSPRRGRLKVAQDGVLGYRNQEEISPARDG